MVNKRRERYVSLGPAPKPLPTDARMWPYLLLAIVVAASGVALGFILQGRAPVQRERKLTIVERVKILEGKTEWATTETLKVKRRVQEIGEKQLAILEFVSNRATTNSLANIVFRTIARVELLEASLKAGPVVKVEPPEPKGE